MIHKVMEFAVHMAADTIISSKVQRSLPVVASLAHQKSNHFVQHHQHLLVQTAYKMAKKRALIVVVQIVQLVRLVQMEFKTAKKRA